MFRLLLRRKVCWTFISFLSETRILILSRQNKSETSFIVFSTLYEKIFISPFYLCLLHFLQSFDRERTLTNGKAR